MVDIKTSDLCDAVQGAEVCELEFKGYGLRHRFSGRIRTVRYVRGLRVLRRLVNEPGNGHVLVIDGAGAQTRAVLGDILAERALQNGWAGFVINGLIRDCEEINMMDIGVKALGVAPRRADHLEDGEIDIPLTFGGLHFVPGCRVIADADGVVVLPEGISDADVASAASGVASSYGYHRYNAYCRRPRRTEVGCEVRCLRA